MRRLALLAFAIALALVMRAARATRSIDPHWSSVAIEVPELDCTFWCSVRLATILDAVDGLRAERFDPRTRQATVRFDPGLRSTADVLDALSSRGIRARIAPTTAR